MIEVGPGLIRLKRTNWDVRDQAAERAFADREEHRESLAEELRTGCKQELDTTSRDETSRKITGWSRKSRANMIRVIASLDTKPLLGGVESPAMLTLTYPDHWEELVPDGPTCKAHLNAFIRRYQRAWNRKLVCIWKLEFQRRGAPHFHLLLAPPHGRSVATGSQVEGLPFDAWAKNAWNEIVFRGLRKKLRYAWGQEEYNRVNGSHQWKGAWVDYQEGARARDPKRMSVYFSKHGQFKAKDYQNDPPDLWVSSGESVGRFWGVRGMSKNLSEKALIDDDFRLISRTLRKLAARQSRRVPGSKYSETDLAVMKVKRPRRRVRNSGEIQPETDADGQVVCDDQGYPLDKLRYRWQTVRVRRFASNQGSGYLVVNDGVGLAKQLSRLVEKCGSGTFDIARIEQSQRAMMAEPMREFLDQQSEALAKPRQMELGIAFHADGKVQTR